VIAAKGLRTEGTNRRWQNHLRAKGIERLQRYIRTKNLATRVETAYQIYSGVNEKDIGPVVKWCVENDYEYKLVTMHTWAGLRSDVPSAQVDGLGGEHRGRRGGPCCLL